MSLLSFFFCNNLVCILNKYTDLLFGLQVIRIILHVLFCCLSSINVMFWKWVHIVAYSSLYTILLYEYAETDRYIPFLLWNVNLCPFFPCYEQFCCKHSGTQLMLHKLLYIHHVMYMTVESLGLRVGPVQPH